jgi:hypothetical protein
VTYYYKELELYDRAVAYTMATAWGEVLPIAKCHQFSVLDQCSGLKASQPVTSVFALQKIPLQKMPFTMKF